MNTSEQINEIAAALSKAQSAMRPAIKDAVNPAYRSKYADLSAVWEAARKPLTDNGLCALQDVTNGDKGISVTTRLIHASGQWIELGPLTVPLAKPDAHGVGSATSYAKRYALAAALGIVAEEDDDGNAAVGTPRNDKGVALGKGAHKPTDGAMDALDDVGKAKARSIASGLVDAWDAGDMEAAAQIWEACKDSDVKVAAWGELAEFSAQRNKFKAYLAEREKKAKVAT